MIAPTLLVGLGGTGSKIVCRVSQMVTEEQRNRWKSGEKKAEYVENFCTGFLSSAVFGDRRLCAAGKKEF